uniref:Uncharacterized protein n=1 Tax=Setaria italica TaxID=4555 RepID=K4AN27_SETIT
MGLILRMVVDYADCAADLAWYSNSVELAYDTGSAVC